jgi:glutathione S-transferase
LLRLYDLDLSPFAARCRLVVYKKGLGDRVELAPPPDGGPRSEAYRAINPIGKVPTLVLEDGTAIPESQVIAEYLEERFPEPPLMPRDPEGRARARLPVRVAELYLLPPLGRLLGQVRPEARDAAVVDAARAEAATALGHLERFMAPEGGWAAGPGFTLADCGLMPLLAGHARVMAAFGEARPLAGSPRLDAYRRRCLDDPTTARVEAEMDAGFKRVFGPG